MVTSSGVILGCHAVNRGSIPGRGRFFVIDRIEESPRRLVCIFFQFQSVIG